MRLSECDSDIGLTEHERGPAQHKLHMEELHFHAGGQWAIRELRRVLSNCRFITLIQGKREKHNQRKRFEMASLVSARSQATAPSAP